MILVYDDVKRHPVAICSEGRYWKILGSCNRCGQCCMDVHFNEWENFKDETGKCNYLYSETVDDILLYGCSKVWNKPYGCALYPFNPLDKNHFLPSCSFSFEEIDKGEFIRIIETLV